MVVDHVAVVVVVTVVFPGGLLRVNLMDTFPNGTDGAARQSPDEEHPVAVRLIQEFEDFGSVSHATMRAEIGVDYHRLQGEHGGTQLHVEARVEVPGFFLASAGGRSCPAR